MTQTVSIRYYSVLAEITGRKNEEFPIRRGQTVKEMLNELSVLYPGMKKYESYIRVAVNQNYESMDYKPAHNDEIVFITPVSGG